MSAVTQWFKASKKPKRVGVYETRFCQSSGFSWWNGKKWSHQLGAKGQFQDVLFQRWHGAAVQEKEWRGLADQPEAA